MVPVGDLFVDDDYQRPLTSFVDAVERDYDPALVGTLIVSERNNAKMAVIDGQTRLEAMVRRGETHAPCLVYHGLTQGQEAQLFGDLQTKRRGMATYLRFRAALVARQPEAVAIADIVTNAGFELGREETRHTVKAIAALEFVYRRDAELLARVMTMIARAWPEPETTHRTSAEIIRGLAVFMTREKQVSEDRLANRLASITPQTLRHRANALREGSGSGSGSTGYMADAILGVYMRGRSNGR